MTDGERVDQLRGAVEDLARVVGDLAGRVTTTEEMQHRQATQRRVNYWLAGSIAFDILLSFGFGFGLLKTFNNTHAITSVQERTSNSVLCPLYALLVSEVSTMTSAQVDANRDGVVSQEERDQMNRTVRVIREGYKALGCPKSS